VPEQPPFVFGSVAAAVWRFSSTTRNPVAEDYPALGAKPIGGSLTLFIEN
jgi:hypothetical protein